ncbi:mechanosensitive ion channel family protein [Aurantiacibacter spongiae]|uniref:mechanosensitive ion channel family protein n=1 Tax=Aurantiacibacter spongiae TaxID=2488860 RepID=UPI001F3A0008|nr:mechanosensitive ion channel family protein [Aurantiacibacter spongiae]
MLPEAPAESPAPDSAPAPAPGSIALDRAADADSRIERFLSETFANVPSLTGVTVTVRQGVVTLGGTAADEEAVTRAESIAGGVEGVVTVENDIERDVSVDLGQGIGGVGDKARQAARMLPLIGAAIVVAVLIGVLGYLLASLTGLWRRIAPNSFLAALIASAIRFVFVIGGIVVALDMIGAGALMGAVLGGAGVIGIALGFAMRDTIETYVASIMLSLRQPFRANDHVVIDTYEGRVIRLTSRATVLMTLDGNHLRIPNSTVFNATILNYTRNPQRRFDFALGVDADDDVEAARRLGRDTLKGLPFVLAEPPPEARISEVGDSNVVLQFLGWIDQTQADWYKARSRAIAVTKAALEQAGFALPEPIYRLRFDQRTGVLPFENVGGGGAKADSAPPSPPQPPAPPPAAPSAADHSDVAPDDEVASMVDRERAANTAGQEKDLLDSSQPVE